MKFAALLACLLAAAWLYADTAHALFEAEATFGSFYDKGWGDLIFWGGIGLLAAAALGAAVFLLEVRQVRSSHRALWHLAR